MLQVQLLVSLVRFRTASLSLSISCELNLDDRVMRNLAAPHHAGPSRGPSKHRRAGHFVDVLGCVCVMEFSVSMSEVPARELAGFAGKARVDERKDE